MKHLDDEDEDEPFDDTEEDEEEDDDEEDAAAAPLCLFASLSLLSLSFLLTSLRSLETSSGLKRGRVTLRRRVRFFKKINSLH